eukprot:TRINITY_DN9852_c0_g1_i4.p1 TRINITY_DN9852_c0_g1~~TRINITY_DN9852_c0_g1_i4.p1  ORF type:complete len:500 (+),score=109.00 TRINITY_DN9852_c0_g1_i4:1103-2602(+)
MLWGGKPLRALEVGGLELLLQEEGSCRLGAVTVRLAMELQRLEEVGAAGANFTRLSAAWGRLRAVGFAETVASGWPAFELFRRIQLHVRPPADRSGELSGMHRWDSSCAAAIRLNDWIWLDAYPRDEVLLKAEGTKMESVYFLRNAIKDTARDGTKVCGLAFATHYFGLAGNILRKPGMDLRVVAFDDGLDDDAAEEDHAHSSFYLRKGQRYVHNAKEVLLSWWPVLSILGQLEATSILYDPEFNYVRPFVLGVGAASTFRPSGLPDAPSAALAGRASGRPTVVEAGAHDGFDSVRYAQAFPTADIWALEANPDVFKALQETIRECGETCRAVTTTQCALGSEDKGSVPFYVNDPETDGDEEDNASSRGISSNWGRDSSSSLFKPAQVSATRFGRFKAEPIEVRLRRLETVAAERRGAVGPLRFLELDAEGGELDILRGVGDLLRDVLAVKLEIYLANSSMRVPYFWPEVKEWLEDHGFAYLIRSASDAFFVRRELALL